MLPVFSGVELATFCSAIIIEKSERHYLAVFCFSIKEAPSDVISKKILTNQKNITSISGQIFVKKTTEIDKYINII